MEHAHTQTPHPTSDTPSCRRIGNTFSPSEISSEVFQTKADTLVNTNIFIVKVTLIVCLFDDYVGPEDHKSPNSNMTYVCICRDRHTANYSSFLKSDRLKPAP